MRMRHCHLLVACLLLAACKQGSRSEEHVTAPARSDKLIRAAEPVPGSYLVALADGLGEGDAAALAARHGATLTGYFPAPVNAALVTLDPAKAIALAEDAAVKFAEEDPVLRVASIDWNLDRIDQRATAGDGAYGHATSGSGVTVYVLDTGVMATHPELVGRAAQAADFVHRAPGAVDCNGHGTHVAGVVAGTTVGVAPAATIQAVRVANCDGVAEASDLVEAIDWVRRNGVTPAVVLIGTTGGPSAVLADAIEALAASGMAIVGPAGNDGGDACSTALGAVPAVVTVGATSAMDVPLASSNRGRCVDLYAPGAAIRSGWNDGGLRLADGTSQAAAHVAGAAALFLEARPEATAAQVADALVGNATVGAVRGVPLGSPDRLLYTGFITTALGADTTAPALGIVAPAGGATVSGDVAVVMGSESTDLVSAALYVDGAWVGSDATPGDGLATTWHTVPYANGLHELEARGYDAAGNVGVAQVTVTVENPGNASWDAELLAPVCGTASERCDSGSLLAGRGPVGPEPHAPNTIRSLCGDGVAGGYQVDESVESIELQAAIPGHALAEGDLVNVDVTVWGYPDFGTDRVDLHFANDAGAPAWQFAGTRELSRAGLQTVRFTYRLPAFPDVPERLQQAVRATVRYGGAPSTCSEGPYDDHDDLAFAVGAGTPDTERPMVEIVSPGSNTEVSGMVTLAATASDPGGGAIGRVEFYVGGVLVGTAMEPTGNGYRVEWLADAVEAREYTVVARAFDASGNRGDSKAITVTVSDLSAPTVALEEPLPGTSVGGLVRIGAVASDNRAVEKVEFKIDSTVVKTVVTPPWAFDWDSTSAAHPEVTIVAVAHDAKNSAESSPVTVRVDNVPPTVSITFPKADEEVQGVVQVRIDAKDNDLIDRVDLYADALFVDTATRDGATDTWVVQWNTGWLENGPVTLTAKAYDAAGNARASDPLRVVVNDTTLPEVVITEPAEDALLHGAVDVGATASDNGVVTRVRFDAGTTFIGEDLYEPFGVSWDTHSHPDGPVTLTATAYDLAGHPGVATRTVRVDNKGPEVTVAPPAGAVVSGTITVTATAKDRYGVDRVDLFAGELFLGQMALASTVATADVVTNTYVLTWNTTEFDNESFPLTTVAIDLVGNVSLSEEPVPFDVSNVTTARWDATLGAPACASPAAWCFSGTLLEGARTSERNFDNTLGGACKDGELSVYHQTESIELVRVATKDGGPLIPGALVTVTVRYWAPVMDEADQLDVYMAADALNPAWQYLGTRTPQTVGLNDAVFETTLPTGPLQAVRANLRFAQPGPATCSGGDFGDHDDLVFAVGSPSDTSAPIAALDTPVDGAVVGADYLLSATVTDDQGVAKVEFLVDGAVLVTLLQPDPDDSTRYSALWPTLLITDGAHEVAVRAFDTSGNVTTTPAVRVTVDNVPNAVFDEGWGVPLCAAVATFCDPGTLLEGRGEVGPELNAPNTILGAGAGACADGDAGAHLVDESLEWLRVSSVDGLPMEAGRRVRVDAHVWAYESWGDDRLAIYTTHTPTDPRWSWVATLAPSGPGENRLSAEFQLPPGGVQVVRGLFALGAPTSACGQGIYDDNDDLAFAVEYTANAVYDKVLHVPACAVAEPWCDSGTLLDGRAALGPEAKAPNTLGGTCLDGTAGSYHASSSVDAIRVLSPDGTPLTAGQSAAVEITVWASSAHRSERVDLFTCADPSAAVPVWAYLRTVRPTREGAQVLFAEVPVTVGAQAIRAHMLQEGVTPPDPIACGITDNPVVVDDHDDLVFTAAVP